MQPAATEARAASTCASRVSASMVVAQKEQRANTHWIVDDKNQATGMHTLWDANKISTCGLIQSSHTLEYDIISNCCMHCIRGRR